MKLERTLILAPGEGNPRNSEGAFVALADGRILFIYTRYYGDSWADHAAAELAARCSCDGGRSWSQEDRIVVPNDGMNVMSVSLLRLADGRIGMTYLRKSETPGGFWDAAPLFRVSVDEGESWSEPAAIAGSPGYYVVNNDRMIQLRSGRVLVPAAYHRYKRCEIGVDLRGIGLFFLSDDGGATWREGEEWVTPPHKLASGFQEPGAVELADGRILAYFRTLAGFQYTALSPDGGEHWETPGLNPAFSSPDAPLSVKRDPAGGELFAVWADNNPRWGVTAAPESWGRTPLALARSGDEGATWHGHTLLERQPDHGYCYTAMHFTGEALLLAYCSGGGAAGVLQELTLARLPL